MHGFRPKCDANESVDDLAINTTGWLRFYVDGATSVKETKINYHNTHSRFPEEFKQLREDWKAESDQPKRQQNRNHYGNELKWVKANYLVNKAAMLSKYGGFYKVLNDSDKTHYGLKPEDPITKKTVSSDAILRSLFHDKLRNKAPDLIKPTNMDLLRILDKLEKFHRQSVRR